jgi:hypothetical protein
MIPEPAHRRKRISAVWLLGRSEEGVSTLRRAALVDDLGTTGVSNSTLER